MLRGKDFGKKVRFEKKEQIRTHREDYSVRLDQMRTEDKMKLG